MRNSNWKIPGLCITAAFCIGLYGHGAGQALAPDSPFYDIFYIYYGESPQKAKGMLRNLVKDPRHGNLSRINLGVVQEIEKNPGMADESYRKAHADGSPLAASYLLALYRRYGDGRRIDVLRSLEKDTSGHWPTYERALEHLRRNDVTSAMDALEDAVKRGFSSRELLDREPLFDIARDAPRFRTLTSSLIIKKRKPGLRLELESLHEEQARNSAWGTGRKIAAAGFLEKKGEFARAAEALDAFLSEKPAFRDTSISLYRMARLKARQGDTKSARAFLSRYIAHLHSTERDPTGYKAIALKIYHDVIANDPALKAVPSVPAP